MEIPLQQTKSWEKLQIELGETCFFESKKDYQFLAILKHTRGGSYLFLPYGPYIRTKSAAKAAYKALERLAKQKNVIFMRIEPQDAKNAEFLLNLPNCQKSHDEDPADTWILDLTPEKSEIISGFSQGTRTRFNQFTKKGLSVTTSKNPADIAHLVRLQQKLAKSKKIGTFSQKYLESELNQDFATLYLVHYNPIAQNTQNTKNVKNTQNIQNSAKSAETLNKFSEGDKIIAASLFFDYAGTRFYMQSAADMEYRRLPATVAILSTALFDAKEKGLKNFDFWGIAPDGAPKSHPWAGLTDFKKSFGGHPAHYAGTHDIVFRPLAYRRYQILRRANRLLRKIKRSHS